MRNTIITLIVILTATIASGQIVATRSSAPQQLIPAAGAVVGNGGTFFRSDITIINYRSADQRVSLQWLPQDASGNGIPPVIITIGGATGIASEDFVTNVMQKSGLGAILVTGITANGTPDSGAQLVATSRIWTTLPNGVGTTSQSLPSMAVPDIVSTNLAIQGARRDTRFRTNAGIVNLSPELQTFQIAVFSSAGTEVRSVDIAAMSMALVPITGAASLTPLQIQVQNLSSTPRTTTFVAFASSVDNTTGDAWTTLGANLPGSAP